MAHSVLKDEYRFPRLFNLAFKVAPNDTKSFYLKENLFQKLQSISTRMCQLTGYAEELCFQVIHKPG